MKRLFLLCMVFLTVFLFSCTWEDDGPDNGMVITGKGFTLKYTVEGRTVATYATVTPETGEDAVQSLYLMFFQPSNDNSGEYIETIEVTGTLAMNSNIPVMLPGGSSLTTTGTYNVLAVANLTENVYLGGIDIDTWFANFAGKTEAQVMAQATAFAEASATGTNSAKIFPEQILMNGRAVKAANASDISLTLTRNVARFDVINTTKADYDLVSVSVWNAYPKSSVFGQGMMDYSSTTGRLRRYYGIDNPSYDDIKGGLYTFENEVPTPKDNDNQTTCLILGLNDHVTGATTYYRVNMHPQNTAQVLKRNYAYRLTITDVLSPGAGTEEEAYTGVGAKLGYTIDAWDLDDNGLIMQDGENILAIPTKTIRIGAEGGEFTYSIYTFSAAGTTVSPLRIKSQTWDPLGPEVRASLNGNTLVVNADPLTAQGQVRQGVIILTYAGMETSVSVIQSGAISTFLEVVLPGGGIPTYGSASGIYSGEIEVKSSGPWTAKLFGNPGFSFAGSGGSAVETISIAGGSPQIRDGRFFQVWTFTPNTESSQRKAFIIVSLDSDPEGYTSVVTLKQNPQGGVDVNPKALNFTVANYATPQTATIDGTTGGGDKSWTATLSGPHAAMFSLSAASGDGVSAGQTSVNVSAVGQNLSGGAYTATLKVALALDATMFAEIPVTQQSSSFSVTPGTFPAIAKTGDQTSDITVNADASYYWSATIATTSGTASDGRTLVNHAATLVDVGGNPLTPGTAYPVTTKFKVAFPKVYYPNREISNITATVTVTLHDAAGVATPMTTTFTVGQTPLTSAGLNAANMNIRSNGSGAGNAWGSLNSGTYETRYRDAMAAIFTVNNGVPQANTTFLHANAYNISTNASNNTAGWATVETFRTTKDAVTVLSMEEDASAEVAAMNSAGTTLANTGYVISTSSNTGASSGVLNTAASATRAYKFLVTNGKSPVSTSVNFYRDGVSTEASTIPASAVSIIKHPSNSNSVLAVDPANRIIYIGELQAVGYNVGWTTDRANFLSNLALYIKYAAQYGSHFTDLLNDNSGVPDLWDPAWGTNASY